MTAAGSHFLLSGGMAVADRLARVSSRAQGEETFAIAIGAGRALAEESISVSLTLPQARNPGITTWQAVTVTVPAEQQFMREI